jgi:hypothetical protein
MMAIVDVALGETLSQGVTATVVRALTVSTGDLMVALKAMRSALLSPSLLAGGWMEEGDDPSPRWPFATLDLASSLWDEQAFTLTEIVYADTASEARTIADTIIRTLDRRGYRGAGVDVRAHRLVSGPQRRRSYSRVEMEILWTVTAVWK